MSAIAFEYVSVREVGLLLKKRKSRMYAMIAEGLLDDAGFRVLRTSGRIWVGVPELERPNRDWYFPIRPFSNSLDQDSPGKEDLNSS